MEIDYEIQRTGNIVSVLLPARKFKIFCAVTKEEALPAVEDFACRLLILLSEINTENLSQYFGLSLHESEILISSLVEKKLAKFNEKGALEPSSLLLNKNNNDFENETSLIKFEEVSETVVLDLLTLKVLPNTRYSDIKFGVLEIPADQKTLDISVEQVIEEFSSQFKSYLELNRKNKKDIENTKLYKVMHCEKDKFINVPLEIEFKLSPTDSDLPKVSREVRSSNRNNYILSYELEACISDFLLNLKSYNNKGVKFLDFCSIFDDKVLVKYFQDGQFNFSNWLVDRDNRLTGYGSSETKGILGPIYIEHNSNIFFKELLKAKKNIDTSKNHPIFWLTSSTPFWGANGVDLSRFNDKLIDSLKSDITDPSLVPFFAEQNETPLKNRYSMRLKNGAMICGENLIDNIEILLIKGVIAVAQYHLVPDPNSSITVPIGFITTDFNRLEKISNFLDSRLLNGRKPKKVWGKFELSDLFTNDELVNMSNTSTVKVIKKRNISREFNLRK